MMAPKIAIGANKPRLHLQKEPKRPTAMKSRKRSSKDSFQSRLARYKPLLFNNAICLISDTISIQMTS
jgi:hypothetical protein